MRNQLCKEFCKPAWKSGSGRGWEGVLGRPDSQECMGHMGLQEECCKLQSFRLFVWEMYLERNSN